MSRAWQIRGVGSQYHVGLPGLSTDTSVNTPPEVIFRLPSPCEDCGAWGTGQVKIKRETRQKRQMSQVAQTVIPRSARAAATAFWVEKMLQAAQRHWAPNTIRVSISTCRRKKHVNFLSGFLDLIKSRLFLMQIRETNATWIIRHCLF